MMLRSILNPMMGNVVNPLFNGEGQIAIPFLSDANTYWWDFRQSQPKNIIDTLGEDTLAYAHDNISNTVLKSLESPNKSRQPLIKTNGIDCNEATFRKMHLIDKTGVCNATNGYYCAFNLKSPTANLRVLSIGGVSGSNALRGQLDFTSTRVIRIRINPNDGATQVTLGQTPALNLDTWYTIEVQVNISNGTAVMSCWVNGILQTLGSVSTPTHNNLFPANDAIDFVVGNSISTAGVTSLNGELQQMIFYNSIPNTQTRESISNYLIGVKP